MPSWQVAGLEVLPVVSPAGYGVSASKPPGHVSRSNSQSTRLGCVRVSGSSRYTATWSGPGEQDVGPSAIRKKAGRRSPDRRFGRGSPESEKPVDVSARRPAPSLAYRAVPGTGQRGGSGWMPRSVALHEFSMIASSSGTSSRSCARRPSIRSVRAPSPSRAQLDSSCGQRAPGIEGEPQVTQPLLGRTGCNIVR